FLILLPVLTGIGTFHYFLNGNIHWADFLIFLIFTILTGLSITAGYHRYFAHRTYECHPVIKIFYLIFGAAALQNSVKHWASDHRNHHRYVDKERDPYNINRGFFWAHMGWIFYDVEEENP